MMRLALSIALLLLVSSCVNDDPFVCRDFCDKWRECNPTVSDLRWDACVDLCSEMDYSRRLVDCMEPLPCDDGFEAVKAACEYDPTNLGGGDEDA